MQAVFRDSADVAEAHLFQPGDSLRCLFSTFEQADQERPRISLGIVEVAKSEPLRPGEPGLDAALRTPHALHDRRQLLELHVRDRAAQLAHAASLAPGK